MIRQASRSGDSPSASGACDDAGGADQQAVDAAVERGRRERRDRQRLDLGVERLVVVPELLEVGQVARARPVARAPRPGRAGRASRPTREDAWMYSAVFFGWPTTSIRPSRCTSTPTCSIEVASTTSNGESRARGRPSCRRVCAASRAWNAAVVSKSGSNSRPSRSRVRPISADAIREVSSPMLRCRTRCRSGGEPGVLARALPTRFCTSSAMYRAMPASSRVALK